MYDWLWAWRKNTSTLMERCKQWAWDEAFSKTNRDNLLERNIQVTRARLLAVTDPNTAAKERALPATNLAFTWTLNVVQLTTTPSGWRWLCALVRWLPNRIPASSANDPLTSVVATGSHAPRVVAALHVTPT